MCQPKFEPYHGMWDTKDIDIIECEGVLPCRITISPQVQDDKIYYLTAKFSHDLVYTQIKLTDSR